MITPIPIPIEVVDVILIEGIDEFIRDLQPDEVTELLNTHNVIESMFDGDGAPNILSETQKTNMTLQQIEDWYKKHSM